MKLPLAIAKKLSLLKESPSLPASTFNRELANQLEQDGILLKIRIGRTKHKFALKEPGLLNDYLKNKYGVNDLEKYIEGLEKEELLGHEAVSIASDSKIKKIRAFKGFLINSYYGISCELNGQDFVCAPPEGSFIFIHNYNSFVVPEDVVIVGIENSENFRLIKQQAHLFEGKKALFVSRYPQSGDLISWLKSINNPYLHYGDFDLAGINIYLTEIKKHLGNRSAFFVPGNISSLINESGSRALYNKQAHLLPAVKNSDEPGLTELIRLIETNKKGLEQQVLIES